jgi:aspT/yidE/ybjL antiporter duplication domain
MDEILVIFLIMVLGYILGKINFFGIRFGASAILIVALFFGHFGYSVPKFLATLGLVLFLAPIGLMAGPSFMANIKKNGWSFLAISLFTALIGGLLVVIISKAFDIETSLSLGLCSGAMTSTSMLGTVKSLTESNLPGVGYGIAYAFGVVGVVLIVQLIPKFLHADTDEENAKLILPEDKKEEDNRDFKELINLDPNGLFAIALACVLGILIGSIKIPIGDSVNLSLGYGGGSLIAGLILGNYGHVGKVNLTISKERLSLVRDLGLAFFLLESGVSAGSGFVEVVSKYGPKLFFAGVIMTLVPALLSFLLSYKVFKLPLFASLGATTGSMTSAPSLGALLQVTQDDKVSSFYAATQPTATIFMVFLPQLVSLFFPIN